MATTFPSGAGATSAKNDLAWADRARSLPVPEGGAGTSDEPSFAVSTSMQPFQVEEHTPPRSRPPAQTNCCLLMLDAVFPFRLLTDIGWRRRRLQRHPCCPSRRAIAGFRKLAPVAPTATGMFTALLVGILLVILVLVYLFLTISSMTPFMQEGKDHRMHNLALRPKVGNHWTLAICGKHLMQTCLIHYLCWQVLEPEPHVAKERVHDPLRLNRPEGVVHWCRRVVARICCYEHEERWLSAFFVDHMLLFIVGLPYCLLQPMLSHVHLLLRGIGIEMEGALQGDELMLTAGIFGLYSGINMVGFLVVTLGNGVRPRHGYAYVFQIATLVLAVLMALEFLVQQQARQRYSQFQLKEVIPFQIALRLCMSASQLFATHGLFMLSAMHLGHAQHFHPCPDLPWRKALTKGAACLLLMISMTGMGCINRSGHSWPKCSAGKFALFAWYESSAQITEIVIGGLLLVVGFRLSSETVELGATEWKLLPAVVAFFDFDSFLIMITFTASLGYRLADVFNCFAEQMFISWTVALCTTVSNLGLAVFTFACWRNPPLYGFPRLYLWMALLLSFDTFMSFQFFEDCEFSSATPGCCDFPSLRDVVGEGLEKWKHCALDIRCEQFHRHPGDNQTYYCGLPLHDHGHGHGAEHPALHRQTPHHPEAFPELYAITWKSTISQEYCKELRHRWQVYPKEFKVAEISEEEESFSTAYRQLKAVGSAGNIEFNFAIFGILLKVIMFVEHPNSVKILHQRSSEERHRLSAAHISRETSPT